MLSACESLRALTIPCTPSVFWACSSWFYKSISF